MSINHATFSTLPVASADLSPAMIQLDDWIAIQVAGIDRQRYLQGQLTCDMNKLVAPNYTFAAHCDATGKVCSNMLLFPQEDSYIYLLRRSVMQQQVDALRKYAVFSNVTITPLVDHQLIGFAGKNIRQRLSVYYQELPNREQPVVRQDRITLLSLPGPSERFIMLATADEVTLLSQQVKQQMDDYDSTQWLALMIESGNPIIDIQTSSQFLPQALNLQAFDAISFTKGCYCGQEMVARAKYRGANKKALYWLAGTANKLPEIGSALELYLEGNWRSTGVILAAVRLADGEIWLQVVLNKTVDAQARFRLPHDKQAKFTFQKLPYMSTE